MRQVYNILEDSRWSSDMINCISQDGYNDISYLLCSFAMGPYHSPTKNWNLCALPEDLGWSCDLF